MSDGELVVTEDGKWRCSRCGWRCSPTEAFIDFLESPSGNPSYPAAKNDKGELFPIRQNGFHGEEQYAWIPQADESVPLWDDAEIVDALEVAKRTSKRVMCTWCYAKYDLPKQ